MLPVIRGRIDRRILVNYRVEALRIERAESSFFDDRRVFPPGSLHLDSALLMRNIQHEWHGCGCGPIERADSAR